MILGEQVMAEMGTGQAHLAATWLPPGGRVLELGCSTGYLTHYFLGKSKQTFGLDRNLPALRRAKQRHPAAPVTGGAAETLPFTDGAFDAVVMLEVIEHTASDAATLAEVRRVLKPGGVLILSTPHAGLFAFLDPHNLRKGFQRRCPGACRLAGRLVRFESGQFTGNLDWHRHYRLRELAELLQPNFAIQLVHRGGLCLYPLMAAAISVVGRVWDHPSALRWLFRLQNWDFGLPFGPLSYNLMLIAIRTS